MRKDIPPLIRDRYTSTKPIEVYAELFKAKAGNLLVEPRHNIAPTYDVLACRAVR